MAATDAQVQAFVNDRLRPRCEQALRLKQLLDQDIASIGDVYANVSAVNPTWTDTRSDAPPHLMTPSDVLALNTFINNIRDALRDNAQWPIVQKCVVREA
jgi:hypothetical protein